MHPRRSIYFAPINVSHASTLVSGSCVSLVVRPAISFKENKTKPKIINLRYNNKDTALLAAFIVLCLRLSVVRTWMPNCFSLPLVSPPRTTIKLIVSKKMIVTKEIEIKIKYYRWKILLRRKPRLHDYNGE
jgi:hypothetical protein